MYLLLNHFLTGDCAQGYYKSSQDTESTFQCNPINECLNASTCHPNATCLYTGPGSHQCQCNEGFTGNGTHCTRKYRLLTLTILINGETLINGEDSKRVTLFTTYHHILPHTTTYPHIPPHTTTCQHIQPHTNT